MRYKMDPVPFNLVNEYKKEVHMICRLKNKGIHILFMVIFVHITGRLAFAFEQDKIIQARQLFYLSVEHRDTIDKAIQLFKEIGENKTYEGVALTYTGALTALKGKFAFLPITKYRRVLKGLHMMDQGIEISPDNLEARFIRGMTCYYQPVKNSLSSIRYWVNHPCHGFSSRACRTES
jgi:hypothetical protein